MFVLGTLERGPAHGHEIRRLAERIDVENWSDAAVGSIYNAIRRLKSERAPSGAPEEIDERGRNCGM